MFENDLMSLYFIQLVDRDGFITTLKYIMKTNILIITTILYTFSFSCRDSGPKDPKLQQKKISCGIL